MNGIAKTFSVQWHITDTCNLRCRHCYQDSYTFNRDLDTDSVKQIIDKLVNGFEDHKISINMTGGEPFLRKDLFEILDYLDRGSNIDEIYLITNGLLINQENALRIERIGKLKGIKVSLEGSNAGINDSIRGRGTFYKIEQSLMNLMSTSKPVILMFTLADYNWQDIINMFEYARRMGAPRVVLERFVPVGQSRRLIKHVLNSRQWFKIIQDIINYFDLGLAPRDFLAYRAFWIDFANKVDLRGALCDHGDFSMALMPNGDIYPCRRTPVKMGNIISDDLMAIIEALRELRRSYKTKLKGKCRECLVESCIGCRALARAVGNDIFSEDPQCFYDLVK